MRILLVDDELLIRSKIKYMIEDEIPHLCGNDRFFLCGEASNGQEAVEKIQQLQPDIIITDMKMPVMDGLAVCRYCRDKHPECVLLVLSNYDDFSYVKESLLSGAADYLLKHSLSTESLLQALEKAEIKSSHKDLEKTSLRVDDLKEEVIKNLLAGGYRDEKLLMSDLKTFQILLSMHRVIPVMMWIRDYTEDAFRENKKLASSVRNIVDGILKDQKNGIICHMHREKYAVLLGYEDIRSEQKTRDRLLFTLNRIRFCMTNFLGLSVNFIIGRIQSSIFSTGDEYHLLETEFQNSFYQEKDVWISERMTERKKDGEGTVFSPEDEKMLLRSLLNGEKEEVERLMDNVLEKFVRIRPAETTCKLILTGILNCYKKACEEDAVSKEHIFYNELKEENILGTQSFQHLSSLLRKLEERFFVEREENRQITSIYLRKALTYIFAHYRENLSQTETAEYAGISSVYLSVLFKNELEDSFPSFLRKVRLKEARRRMDEGETNLKIIAEQSGFQDYTYFLKCFKKEYSCTPKEYIKKQDFL